MQADLTTIQDLSIFERDEQFSVFHFLDQTKTIGGREWLESYFKKPLATLEDIHQTQALLKKFTAVSHQWPDDISNGTIMVVEKFYQSGISGLPERPTIINAFSYKIFNVSDYSIIRYSVKYFIQLIRGMHEIDLLLNGNDNPLILQKLLNEVALLLKSPGIDEIKKLDYKEKLSRVKILFFANYFLHQYKSACFTLIQLFYRFDGYMSMALAGEKFHFSYPIFYDDPWPHFEAKELFHPLLKIPVAYPINISHEKNFLFLTGANMSGKSTFIKAVGVAAYLAHLGMAVPAASLRLSFFDGLLSNIQVADNIVKGESYFFNEVQRIKSTIIKISNGKKWLILIDELFKGTNIEDAMRCSTVVIEGLLKMKNALFILSTHLYEIAETLQHFPNIFFHYFETNIENGRLVFNYQLKPGVSVDKLGYLILKNEGVVELLDHIKV
ncbi:MAG: DNA mismatch repair protein MutS [Bacteroidetes bacterium]|nr:DNA mismatch repair protein MutS [Bacteroidota bacterium]